MRRAAVLTSRRRAPSLQIDHTLRNRQTRPVPELDLLRGRHVGGQKTHKQRGHGLIKEEASLLKIHAPKQQINPREFSSFVGRIDSSLKRLHERLSLGRPASPPPPAQPYPNCPSSSGRAEKRPSESRKRRDPKNKKGSF